MNGLVDAFGPALLAIEISPAGSGETTQIEVWVTDRFLANLVLPVRELPTWIYKSGSVDAVLADGTPIEFHTYTSRDNWFGSDRQLEVVANNGDYPLLGVDCCWDLSCEDWSPDAESVITDALIGHLVLATTAISGRREKTYHQAGRTPLRCMAWFAGVEAEIDPPPTTSRKISRPGTKRKHFGDAVILRALPCVPNNVHDNTPVVMEERRSDFDQIRLVRDAVRRFVVIDI